MNYVCVSSSLYPIDLASIIFYYADGKINNKDRIKIFVVDDIYITDNIVHRILSPQLALPSHFLVHDKEDTYRPVFIPISNEFKDSYIESLSQSISLVVNAVSNFNNKEGEKVNDRGKQILANLFSKTSYDEQPGGFVGLMCKYIFKDIFKRDIDVKLYSKFIYSLEGQTLAIEALRDFGMEILNELGNNKFRFLKGGFIELDFKSIVKYRLRTGKIKNNEIIFYNSDDEIRMSLSLRDRQKKKTNIEFKGKKISDFKIRLRGPIELVYEAKLGINTHVPWYCKSIFNSVQNWHIYTVEEMISPISVAVKDRTSIKVGGKGKRLIPSGYSLIEFEHPSVLAYIKTTTNIGDIDYKMLDDWYNIINNYPKSNEKVLKHQGGVNEYINSNLISIRKQLIVGSAQPILSYISSNGNPVQYGRAIINLIGCIKFIKDCTIIANKFVYSPKQRNLLIRLSMINNDNKPLLNKITSRVKKLINDSNTWRKHISIPRQFLENFVEVNFIKNIEELENKPWLLNNSNFKNLFIDNNLPLDKWAYELRCEAIQYYKCVVSLISSCLKADIFRSWLLMGSNDYISVVKKLLNKRIKKSFIMSAKLWDID